MNKKILFISSFALFAACGDDSSTASDYDFVWNSKDEATELCKSSREGWTAIYTPDNTELICKYDKNDEVWRWTEQCENCDKSSSSNKNLHSSSSTTKNSSSSSSKKANSSSSSKIQSSSSETVLSSSSGKVQSSSTKEVLSSSSKEVKSSSSSAKSSSSVRSSSSLRDTPLIPPCRTKDEDNCEYGTLIDERDGQTYKTVKIGDQEWMAQELNYAYKEYSTTQDSLSFSNGGRYYAWSGAADSVGVLNSDGLGCGYNTRVKVKCEQKLPMQGVCPNGWHIPDTTEWMTLIRGVDIESSNEFDIIGKALSAERGWYSTSFYGNDSYGFSIHATNYWEMERHAIHSIDGWEGTFWTSTRESDTTTYIVRFYGGGDPTIKDILTSHYAFSIRCIKNKPEIAPKAASED